MSDGMHCGLLVATSGRGSAEARGTVGRFDDEWWVGDVGDNGCDGRVYGGRDLGAFERYGEGITLAEGSLRLDGGDVCQDFFCHSGIMG